MCAVTEPKEIRSSSVVGNLRKPSEIRATEEPERENQDSFQKGKQV